MSYVRNLIFPALILLMSVIVINCTDEAKDAASGPAQGKVIITQMFPLNVDDLSVLKQDPAVAQAMLDEGWTETTRGVERSKVFDPKALRDQLRGEFLFKVNGEQIPVNEDGTVNFTRKPDPQDQVILVARHENTDGTFVEDPFSATNVKFSLSPNNDNVDIVILWDKSVPHDMSGMNMPMGDDDSMATQQSALGVNDPWACRDYNGSMGDCKMYSSGYARYRNFLGSDCSKAWALWGLCFMDFSRWDYCNNTNRNCSGLIRHSNLHHCH